ncbi:MAG: hypothetical protein GY937_22445 [bacterium]|nr:hypothetical protein [bacterium]
MIRFLRFLVIANKVFEWLRDKSREYSDLCACSESREATAQLLFDMAEFLEGAGKAGALGVPLRLKRDDGGNCGRKDKLAWLSRLIVERELSEPGDGARSELGRELERNLTAAARRNSEAASAAFHASRRHTDVEQTEEVRDDA